MTKDKHLKKLELGIMDFKNKNKYILFLKVTIKAEKITILRFF